jgi:hypothetical protein
MLFEPPYSQTIHYTQLTNLPVGHPLHRPYGTYLRELPRLLAAGLEGRWVLIKDDEVVGDFATHVEASTAGMERFGIGQYMIKRVHEQEPVFRVPYPVV